MAPAGVQQGGDLCRQLVIIAAGGLFGRMERQIQETVGLVVEGRSGHGFYHPPVRQQTRFLFESVKVLAYGQGAGGEDDGVFLVPQCTAELGIEVGRYSAQHGAAPLVLHGVEHHIGVLAGEQFHSAGQLLHLPVGGS